MWVIHNRFVSRCCLSCLQGNGKSKRQLKKRNSGNKLVNRKYKKSHAMLQCCNLSLIIKVSIVDTTKCIITVANKVGVSEMAKQYATNLIDEVTKKGNECRKKIPWGFRKVVYIMYQNK